MNFEGFPKISRYEKDIIITEKIDGANAQVFIGHSTPKCEVDSSELYSDGVYSVKAGSRSRWITPENDNFGFAKWVKDNAEELIKLGPGRHYGEWWGQGIQRNYGLKERRFSLFNVSRWSETRPDCCHVVPVLYTGSWITADTGISAISDCMRFLELNGSKAASGFMNPEGIVIFHTASGTLFKKTYEKDRKEHDMSDGFDLYRELQNRKPMDALVNGGKWEK